ncbi:MAG: hypothetical protein RIM84_10820 [Alphaproteobacteria bacterium]
MASKKNSSPQATPAAGAAKTEGRVTLTHGPFLIVAGRRNDTCAAIGYLANKLIDQTAAESVEAAIEALIETLDQRTAEQRELRVDGVPTETEYREAIAVLAAKMSKRFKAMLATHCRQPNAASTMHDLARRFEVAEKTAALDYGKLARGLTGLLDFAPQNEDLDRKLIPLLSLATLDNVSESGRPILRLRPELVGALRTSQQIEV